MVYKTIILTCRPPIPGGGNGKMKNENKAIPPWIPPWNGLPHSYLPSPFRGEVGMGGNEKRIINKIYEKIKLVR